MNIKTIIIGIACFTAFIFCGLLNLQIEKKKESVDYKIPGSYQALDLQSFNRAYPEADIPIDGYTRGLKQHNSLKQNSEMNLKTTNSKWEAMGPLNTSGRTLTIAVNPQADSTIYAGSASGGLWRSRKLGLGTSWEYVSTGFPVLGVSAIEFAPNDSMTMYLGTGEVYNFSDTGTDGAFRSTRGSYGIGILKSIDGGATWSKSLDWTYNQRHGVWMIKIAQTNSEIVYANTTQGVYRSRNGGKDWLNVLDVIMGTDLDVDPRNSENVVACFGNFGSPRGGIYTTTDGGRSWMKVPSGTWNNFRGKILIDRSKSNPDVLFASVGNGFSGNDGMTWLLKSVDNGLTWNEVNNLDYSQWQGWFSHDLSINPDDENILMTCGIDIYKSIDGGKNLNRASNGGVTLGTPSIGGPDGNAFYSHSDHHFIAYHPNIKDLILIGNDGGVFLSFDGGGTFQSANGGYQSTQFYNGFSISKTDQNYAMGGLQDNSTSIFRGTGAWQRAIGGDGSWSAVNQRNDNIVFASWQGLNILKSTDKGLSFNNVSLPWGANENPLFIAPFIITDSTFPVMYAGGKFVYKSNDLGESWERMNRGEQLNGDAIFCMHAAPSNAQVLYVGTVPINDVPRVMVSQDGAESFTISNSSFPNRVPNDIAIHPFDPSVAFVCFSGFGTDHVFKTEDFGITWFAINGLPDVPTNAIAIDPADPNIIYVGNDIAVYVSSDGGQNWSIFGNSLPDAFIAMDLTISPSDRQIWMATHGNGSYKADMLPSLVSVDDLAGIDFEIYPNPASDIINVSLPKEEIIEWTLWDISGRLIKKGRDKKVSVTDLENGNYFISIRAKNKIQGKKFVVAR